jgi:hypothetical protein
MTEAKSVTEDLKVGIALLDCCFREAMAGSGSGAPDKYNLEIRSCPLLKA